MPVSANDKDAVAVLISGGLDSAVLCAELASQYHKLYPLYVRFGLRWEAAELAHVRAFLSAIATPKLAPLTILDAPMADIYDNHWSIDGQPPGADSPDEAVYLPGRNLLLLAKAAIWCRLHGVARIALGTLQANPFSDAAPAFDAAMEQAIRLGMDTAFAIDRPYRHLAKSEVLQRGRQLPLELTFSCINPVGGRHCGACNKCSERRRTFDAAGISDKTAYATEVNHVPGNPRD